MPTKPVSFLRLPGKERIEGPPSILDEVKALREVAFGMDAKDKDLKAREETQGEVERRRQEELQQRERSLFEQFWCLVGDRGEVIPAGWPKDNPLKRIETELEGVKIGIAQSITNNLQQKRQVIITVGFWKYPSEGDPVGYKYIIDSEGSGNKLKSDVGTGADRHRRYPSLEEDDLANLEYLTAELAETPTLLRT